MIREDSLIIKVRAQEVRHARRLHGGSDLGPDESLIVVVLQGLALCGDCLARKTGIARWQIEEVLQHIGATFKVASTVARCDGCLKQRVVHRLG